MDEERFMFGPPSRAELNKSITYLDGDATRPYDDGNRQRKLIAHVVNNVNRWGSGFVVGLGERFPLAKSAYHAWAAGEKYYAAPGQRASNWWVTDNGPFALGNTQLVRCSGDIAVANMCAQDGLPTRTNRKVVDYSAISACMYEVLVIAADGSASIHMPRIGCGRGGGEWDSILDAIWIAVADMPFNFVMPPIYVYDYQG